MEVIYGLIPGMLVLGLAAVAVLFWAARSGQFDDLEGDGQRLLLDEDEEHDHDWSDSRRHSGAGSGTRPDGQSSD